MIKNKIKQEKIDDEWDEPTVGYKVVKKYIGKDPAKVKQGRLNRRHGQEFEKKVMAFMENKGWICARWTKNLDYDEGNDLLQWEGGYKLVNSRQGGFRLSTTGFPDFIAYKSSDFERFICPECKKLIKVEPCNCPFEIIGVECKGGDYKHNKLDKIEKTKAQWLLDNKVFSKMFIAHKTETKGEIALEEFKK
jgi:hypothetical protein